MSNSAVLTMAWSAFALHALVAWVVLRRITDLPLVHWLNCATALAVLAYWVPRWYSYAFEGISWYASDQLIPLYAIIVFAISVAALAFTYKSMVFPWLFFCINGLVALAAALFFTFFRLDKLF